MSSPDSSNTGGRRNRKPKRARLAPPGGWGAADKSPVVPSTAETPAKTVRSSLDVDHAEVLQRRLVWRFGEVDSGGAWPPSQISADQMANLLQKMASFESMRIGEIFRNDSEHGKKYAVEKLPAKALARLVDLERDDETEIARLRCGGAPRLYGFLREHVFHVIWWDAKHEVYPSKKKHT